MIKYTFFNVLKKIKKLKPAEWLDERVENLENQRFANKTLPFRIIEAKEAGFLAKIFGVYAFISYYRMPWKYNDINSWNAISKTLIDKVFLCKIHLIQKKPLSIVLDGAIPQFEKIGLSIGAEYTGLIVKKTDFGALVDVGYHFDWKYGSVLGLMRKSQFYSDEFFSLCYDGDEIKIIFHGYNENENLIYSQHKLLEISVPDEEQKNLIGEIVEVRIVRNSNEEMPYFLVLGMYYGKICFEKKNEVSENLKEYKRRVKEAIRKLPDEKIIHCEVIGFSKENNLFELYWSVGEIEAAMDELLAEAITKAEFKGRGVDIGLKILGKIELKEINYITAKESIAKDEEYAREFARETEEAEKEAEEVKEIIRKSISVKAIVEAEMVIHKVVNKAKEATKNAQEIAKRTRTKAVERAIKRATRATKRTVEKAEEAVEIIERRTKKRDEKERINTRNFNDIKILGKINLETINSKTRSDTERKEELEKGHKSKETNRIQARAEKIKEEYIFNYSNNPDN